MKVVGEERGRGDDKWRTPNSTPPPPGSVIHSSWQPYGDPGGNGGHPEQRAGDRLARSPSSRITAINIYN